MKLILFFCYFFFFVISVIYAQNIYPNAYQCYQNVSGAGLQPSSQLTYTSYCLFSSSCTPPFNILVDAGTAANPHSVGTGNGNITKLIYCSGYINPFVFSYYVQTSTIITNPLDPPVPQCTYTYTYTDCKQTLPLSNISASTVWQDSISTMVVNDLHTTVTQGSDNNLASLCAQLTNGGANLECIPPYAKQTADPHSPCVLQQTIDLFCHEHKMQCNATSVTNSNTCSGVMYNCNSTDVTILDAICPNVPLVTMQNLIADSNSMSTTYPTCTILRNSYCSTFECFLPWATSNPGAFCELPFNYTNVQPFCGSNQRYNMITCYSSTGRSGPHTCIYPLYNSFLQLNTPSEITGLAVPVLQVNCLSTSSAPFQPLYDAALDIDNTAFPLITIIEFEQLFCTVVNSPTCPLWQLDGLPLTCNSTLRQEFGITSMSSSFSQARLRLLSILSYYDELGTNSNTYQSHSNLSPSLMEYLQEFPTIFDANTLQTGFSGFNTSHPTGPGNSMCQQNSQCASLISRQFKPSTLANNLFRLASSSSELQLNTNYHDPISLSNVLKTGSSSANRELLYINESLSWTTALFNSYLNKECAYGLAEHNLCSNIISEICPSNVNNVIDCCGGYTTEQCSNPGLNPTGLNYETFCTSYVASTCSVTATLPSTYTFFCAASVTYQHEVDCVVVDPVNCLYLCSSNDYYLSLNNVELSAHILFDVSTSSADQCHYLNQAWQASNYVSGDCQLPYVHIPNEQICYFNQIQPVYTLQCGVMDIQCNQINSTSQLLPGYNLTDSNGNPYYTCITSGYSYPAFNNFSSAFSSSSIQTIHNNCSQSPLGTHYSALYAALVPLSYITTESSQDLDIQCTSLRDYIQQQQQSLSTNYSYCCAETTPVLKNVGMCQSTFLPGTYPLAFQFNCSDQGAIWPISCQYNAGNGQYACSSSGLLNFKCTEIDPWSLYGEFVGPLATYVNNSQIIEQIRFDQCMIIKRSCHTSFLSKNSDFFACDPLLFASNQNLNQFCQPSVNNLAPAFSSNLNQIIDFPVFYCGTNPQHPMFCSNFNSDAYDFIRCSNDYTQIYSPSYIANLTRANVTLSLQPVSPALQMNCLYRSNVFLNSQEAWASDFLASLTPLQKTLLLNSTLAYVSGFTNPSIQLNITTAQWLFNQSKPEVCAALFTQCAPFTCANGKITVSLPSGSLTNLNNLTAGVIGTSNISAGCPSPVYQVLQCILPGQMCDGVYCQYNPIITSSSNNTNNGLGTCTFTANIQNFTCNGYNIFCSRLTTQVTDLGLVKYSCVHAGIPDFPQMHLQNPLITLQESAYTTFTTYQQAIAASGEADVIITNPSLMHTLNMNCIVESELLSIGTGYNSGFDHSLCSGLSTDACNNLQVCQQMGTNCLSTGQLTCGQNGLPTLSQPFCVESFQTPTLQDTFFTCNGLAIQCYLPGQCTQTGDCVIAVEANSIFCTSNSVLGQPSVVWELLQNLDGLQNPLNVQPNLGNTTFQLLNPNIYDINGCQLPYPYFYLNEVTRCGLLFDHCNYQCFDPNGNGVLNPNGDTNNFCDSITKQETVFQCDQQWITCSLDVNTITSSSYSQYLQNDPDYIFNQQMMHCTSFTPTTFSEYNNTLFLDCQVNQGLLLNDTTTSCSTLISQCRANAGSITCAPGWIATLQAPLCTTPVAQEQPSPLCDCSVW